MGRLPSILLFISLFIVLLNAQGNAFNAGSIADVLASANLNSRGNNVAVTTNNPNVQASANTTDEDTFAVNSTDTTGQSNPDLAVDLSNNDNNEAGSLTSVSLGGGDANASSNADAAQINTNSNDDGNGNTTVSVQQLPDGSLNVTVNVTTNSSGANSGCDQSQYSDASGNCQNCDASCLDCVDSSTKCTSCRPGYDLANYQCLCPSGQYQSNGNCIACSGNCSSCDANGVCQGCINGYSILNGTCGCPSGSYESNGHCYSCGEGEIQNLSGVSTYLSACANYVSSTVTNTINTVTNRTIGSGASLGLNLILFTSSAVVAITAIL